MEMCDENHDAIVHDEKYCPVCSCIDEISGLKEQVDDLTEKVADLQDEIDNHECEPAK